MTDIQAAIGLAQLKKLDQFIIQRKNNYSTLYEKLKSLDEYLKLPKPSPNSNPVWFGFPILVKKKSPLSRIEIIRILNKGYIGTRLLFGGNLTKQPLYQGNFFRICGELTNTDRIMNDVFWIGVQPNLSLEMIQFVIDKLTSIMKNKEQEYV